VEVSDRGARLAAYPEKGPPAGLTPYAGAPFVPGRPYKVKLRRDGGTVTGWVDGVRLGPVAVSDPAQKALLAEPQRFKFYGWQGGLYTVKDAVLTDGPEED
jgi:hypothetical protein